MFFDSSFLLIVCFVTFRVFCFSKQTIVGFLFCLFFLLLRLFSVFCVPRILLTVLFDLCATF